MRSFLLLSLLLSLIWAEERVVQVQDFAHQWVEPVETKEKIAITCYGGAVQQIALFLGEEAISAHPGAQRFPFFEKLYPGLAQKPSIGTFSDVNFETLLKVKPDLVFAGVTSLQTNERIKALGIPVFTLGIGRHTMRTLLEEFRAVGIFLGKEKKAEELIAYWKEQLQQIERNLPAQEQRKKVLYINGAFKLSSEGKGWWGDDFITQAGGVNIAKDIQVKGSITPELLLAFDPDVIIVSNNRNFKTSPEELMQNPLFKNLKAVQEGEVYFSPVGGFWWDRPSPEAILGIVWLSKILYPQQMHSVDLKRETKHFFEHFYHYKLQDKEYESFFARAKDRR
ncbi:ABC transporter substrate-binding protein [Sulfurovum sp.]|jgi:iron complex transport system substrate-binding protein|uniref:ABC transporter substrate-binding protein n=1 Tax=Sulfurovum sp. TaxID=1969726 RepID=UPI002A371498|nr:ABC transporter substrate-binding protein [Sulfurovum sp.]MDD2450822.1 ABC transporter substrate-binding protein [Sulfurovum sp.]MDD3498777.1 ABC transporter substrate-binding protein [Sulfurovum sp.]MDY0402056.1 ABC transporter substrate-binding protein [Sulfurovum sp.]